MERTVTIGARIDADLYQNLDRLAQATGRSKSWHLSEALRTYIASERDFIEAVQAGLNDAKAGKILDHDEVKRRLARRMKTGRGNAHPSRQPITRVRRVK